jgi:hypothetical protein
MVGVHKTEQNAVDRKLGALSGGHLNSFTVI